MKNIIPFLLVLLIVIGGMIGLQIFLSTRKNKWLGLIMPFICVAYSLLSIGALVTFQGTTTTRVTSYAEDGTIIEDIIREDRDTSSKDVGHLVSSSIVIFIVMNIPTAIGLLIYFAYREKLKKKQQLEHMQIQDLE